MRLFGYEVSLKFVIVEWQLKFVIVEWHRYASQRWWERGFFHFCTGFGFPNIGGRFDASRFAGGCYTASWDYRAEHAARFGRKEAARILEFYREEDRRAGRMAVDGEGRIVEFDRREGGNGGIRIGDFRLRFAFPVLDIRRDYL